MIASFSASHFPPMKRPNDCESILCLTSAWTEKHSSRITENIWEEQNVKEQREGVYDSTKTDLKHWKFPGRIFNLVVSWLKHQA